MIYILYLSLFFSLSLSLSLYIYINEIGADIFEGKVKVLNQYLSKRELRVQLVVDRIKLSFCLLTHMNILHICEKSTQ